VTGRRWAISPSDNEAHLLVRQQLVVGYLRVRCSAILPVDVAQLDEEPAGAVCAACWIVARTKGD